MPTNRRTPKETVCYCATCGAEIVLYYAGDSDNNKFCNEKHRREWHNVLPLSASRLSILAKLETGAKILPYTDTVMRMSGELGRDVAMITLVERTNNGKKYELSEFGKKVLDRHRET